MAKTPQQVAAASLVVAARRQDAVIQAALDALLSLGTILDTIYPPAEGDPPSEAHTILEALRDPRAGIPAQRAAIAKFIAALQTYA